MIDPAEALLAITGIGLLTGERKADVSIEEIHRAQNLGQSLAAKAVSAVNGSLDARPPAPINFHRAMNSLSKLQTHADHVGRQQKFPAGYHALAMSYNVLLHQLQPQLLQMMPRTVFQTVAGAELSPPSDLAFWKFLAVLQMIDEPLNVFRAISTGSLSKKQAGAVRLVYPSLSAAIDSALATAVIEKPQKWRPNWVLQRGLSHWFGGTSLPHGMVARLQQSHAMEAQQRQQQPVPGDKAGPASADSQSPAQRAQGLNV